jgi:hypothetical protein
MPHSNRQRPTADREMSVEYLLVVYEQDRDVLADGHRIGVTDALSCILSDARETLPRPG